MHLAGTFGPDEPFLAAGTELLWRVWHRLICNGNLKMTCDIIRLKVVVAATVGAAHVAVVTPTRRWLCNAGSGGLVLAARKQTLTWHECSVILTRSSIFLQTPLHPLPCLPFHSEPLTGCSLQHLETRLYRSRVFSFISSVLHAFRNYIFPFLLPITSTDVLVPYPRVLKRG